MRQRNVLRNQPGGVNEDAFFVALAAFLVAGHQILNFAMELFA